ncbi:MAG: serine/threonine protein kinase [Proteobacteria bacterium]|nr:serine/threonine protein kinase [Pseudomonadota bacterium]
MGGARDPWVGQVLEGRYELIAPLGQGGAARIYRAIQQPMGREVAVKLVRPDHDGATREEFEERFLREAAAAGRFAHPAIVRVYDYGRTEEGDCFIVMELLRGRTLSRVISGGEPMDEDEAARITAVLARGLRHAHSRGFVHRDVKPGNVLLVLDDEGVEQPKLLDFRLVKVADADAVTAQGQFMGTPHYIAPEQAAGTAVDGRADQYALGVVLYRLLTGVLPFAAEHPMGIALAHMKDPYPSMASRAPEVHVDPDLEAIVRRMMEKEPDDRFADGRSLAKALEEWRGQGPVLTEESTIAPVAMPTAPAPSRGPLAAGLLGLTLLVSGGGALWVAGQDEVEDVPDARLEVAPLEAAVEPVVEEPVVEEPVEPAVVEEPVEPVVVEEPVEPVLVEPVEPKPRPKPVEPVETVQEAASLQYDGVWMTPSQAAATLAFVNTADEAGLKEAGVYGRGVGLILENRPFASMDEFADTAYIGDKTVAAALQE